MLQGNSVRTLLHYLQVAGDQLTVQVLISDKEHIGGVKQTLNVSLPRCMAL